MDTVTEFAEVQGACKYRRRTPDEKRQIVEETLSSGRSVAEIARSHEVNANQVFDWRKQYLEGRLGADARECTLLPVTVNETGDSGVTEPAASTPAAPTVEHSKSVNPDSCGKPRRATNVVWRIDRFITTRSAVKVSGALKTLG
jgi:transposase